MPESKLSKFFKNRYVTRGRDLVAEDYENSDYGRIYGWWVIVGGVKAASLEYRCFLEEPVHLYSVSVLDDAFYHINLDSQQWQNPAVTIQSKYAERFGKQGLQMAAVGNNMIVVEKLFLPEPIFRRKHEEIVAFQNKLLAKAEKNEKLDTKKSEGEKGAKKLEGNEVKSEDSDTLTESDLEKMNE